MGFPFLAVISRGLLGWPCKYLGLRRKGAKRVIAGELYFITLTYDLEGRCSPVGAGRDGLAGYATGGQPWGTVRLRLVAVFGRPLVGWLAGG